MGLELALLRKSFLAKFAFVRAKTWKIINRSCFDNVKNKYKNKITCMRKMVISENGLSVECCSTLTAFVRPFSYKLNVELEIPFIQVKK